MAQIYELGDNDVTVDLGNSSKGQLKTDINQRLGESVQKGYSVTFRAVHRVHGNFGPGVEDDASFLVLKIVPTTDSPGRRFKHFTVSLTVEPAAGTGINDEPPYLVSYEPALQGEQFFQERVTAVQDATTYSASLNPQAPVGGGGSLSASRATSKQFEQRRLLKLSSKSVGRKSEPDRTVTWQLAPAVEDDGIGDILAVGLLVKRVPGAKFLLRADTTAKVTFRPKDALSWVTRDKELDLLLDPFSKLAGPPLAEPAGVVATHLHAASTEALHRLTYLHLPEKVEPRSFAPAPQAVQSGPSSVVQEAESLPTEQLSPHGSGSAVPIQEMPAMSSIPVPPGQVNSYPLKPSSPRAIRLRMMAALYHRLAILHREEADEAEALDEAAFADEVVRIGL